MPEPIVHRDIKAMNILVAREAEEEEEEMTGKVGDCGESRRVDLNLTMTKTGSPLWAAPEILLGKRYREDVDTYSLGVVLYEIAARQLPYMNEIMKKKQGSGKISAAKIMREVAAGTRRPHLTARICRRYGIGRLFKKRRSFFCRGVCVVAMFVLTCSFPFPFQS